MSAQISLNDKAPGFYLGLASAVLAIISLVFYVIYGNATGERNPMILIPLIVVVALQAGSIFVDNDILTILTPVVCAVALCSFVVDSVNTLVGYFFNLAMFGDVSMIGSVARLCALMSVAVVTAVVAAFLKKTKLTDTIGDSPEVRRNRSPCFRVAPFSYYGKWDILITG